MGWRGAARRLARHLCRRRRGDALAGIPGADRREVRHAGPQPGPPSRRQGDYSLALIAGQGTYKDQISRQCSRPTTARASRRRGSHRPTSRSASPEPLLPTPPKCRLGGKRYRGSEGGADALRRPWPSRLRLRGARLSAPMLPGLLDNDDDFLQDATGDRRYWPSRSARPRRHRGLYAATATSSSRRRGRGCGPVSGTGRRRKRKNGSSRPSGGPMPERRWSRRHPAALPRRGAADDAAEPRGFCLEMGETGATPARVVSRRFLRPVLRRLCGREAAGARPGLEAGHLVLHDVAARPTAGGEFERDCRMGRG